MLGRTHEHDVGGNYYSGNVIFEQQSSGYAVFSGKFALFHSLSSIIYLPD